MATNFQSFNEDEIEAADSLIVLALYQTKKEALNSRFRFRRWGSKRRRSIPKDSKIQDDDEEDEEETKKGLSPSTPLSLSPSGGDPPPPTRARKVFKKTEQHRAWVKEQNQRIAALSATKLTLQHGVLEAKRRYHMLRETNSWLRELRSKWRGTLVAQRGGGGGGGGEGRSADWCLPWMGPATNQRMDSNRSLDEEEWRRRWAAYAAARKRRMDLQRVKSPSVRIQRLR